MSSLKVSVVLAVAVSTTLFMTSYIRAAEVELTWDAPTDLAHGTPLQDLAGYRIYYGLTSGLYDFVLDVGNLTTYTLSGLKGGRRYYFSIVAYDTSLNESQLSEEVETITPFDPTSDDVDSDEESLLEVAESAIHGTDLFLGDSEGDGLADGFEDSAEFDPSDPTSTQVPASYDWTNYWIRLTMRSEDDGAIGVMFRYQDSDNYYRFSWHSDGAYGLLTKRYNGAFTLLAEEAIPYMPVWPYVVDIVADGETLQVSIGGKVIFSVIDSHLQEGSIGLYTWFNGAGSFDDVLVQDLDTEAVLLWDDFNHDNLTSWTVVDEGTWITPSAWSLSDGVLSQSSKIHSKLGDPADIAYHGTYVVYTN